MACLAQKESDIHATINGDLFDSLGRKADQITKKQNENSESLSGVTNSVIGLEDISTDDDDQKIVDEIESLCMNCHADGVTRLLLTRIPYFREIIISSFSCSHCNFKNSEIQSAGQIQQKGCKYELRLTKHCDFSRQVVKSDTCIVKFIELDVEVPAGRGQLSNVEGLLRMIIEDLEIQQPERKERIPEVAAKIEEIIFKGYKMIDGESFPFRVEIDDPAGNSWIEPDLKDGVGKLSKIEYTRTPDQNESLGLSADRNDPQSINQNIPESSIPENDETVSNEVYSFPATCPGCTSYCITHMKMVDIPHFKQVIIMSTVCDHCGYRSNEVKTGGEIPEKGKKIILRVESPVDLARDILKSESCALECPELSLSVNPGTLGSRFTTVEGLLSQIRDDLHQHIFNIDDESAGDSLTMETKQTWTSFFAQLDEAIRGERVFTVILTDPLACSYVQNLYLPQNDPLITIEEYERTKEEEDELGLNDMNTENYMNEDHRQKIVEKPVNKINLG